MSGERERKSLESLDQDSPLKSQARSQSDFIDFEQDLETNNICKNINFRLELKPRLIHWSASTDVRHRTRISQSTKYAWKHRYKSGTT